MPLIEAQPDAVATTYAHSIFHLAKNAGGQARVEEVVGQLEEILDLARSDRRFGEFLSSRIVAIKARHAALERIFAGRVDPFVANLLLVLNDNGRLANLPAVVAALDRLVQNAFGRVEVDVYTAAPLEREELDALRGRLQSALGREPILHAYVDASILGGLRLQIGDRLIDASVATRLRRLRDQIEDAALPAIRLLSTRLFGDAHGQSNGNGTMA